MHPLVFFGTPDFAVPSLRALAATEFRPALVISQPSRPAGRGKKMLEPAVVVAARELEISCEQVERVRDAAFLASVAALAPEIAVVVAFGQIFPRALLELPRRGCINLHASLLPRWRGAAPIQAAIRAGDRRTGVTTMQMEAGLDSGPMLLERATGIGARETAGELSERLAVIGAELLIETLHGLTRGELFPRLQAEEAATFAPKVTKESTRVDWSHSAVEIERAVRAFQPKPGAEIRLRDEPVKLIEVRVGEGDFAGSAESPKPGLVRAIERDELVVAAGAGSELTILRAQRAGRGPVSGGELARALGLACGVELA